MRYYAGVGARVTPLDVCARMTKIARELREAGFWLRSGGAIRADQAFEAGAGAQCEIFLQHHCTRDAYALAATLHPAWDKCGHSTRLKHGRNVMIVLGPDLRTPVERVICWTPGGVPAGGTGMAIRVAQAHGIPVTNLYHPDVQQGRLF